MIKEYSNTLYFNKVGGSLSRTFNTIFLLGHPSESICGRCWRTRLENPEKRFWWRLCRTIDFIWFWEEDHCKIAYEYDISYSYARVEQHVKLLNGKIKIKEY